MGSQPYFLDPLSFPPRFTPRAPKKVPLLVLDIDGTVREGKDDSLGRFVNGPDDVRVFPAAVANIRRWKARGGRVIGVSNQGGVALGILSMGDMVAAMRETARQCNSLFDALSACCHHPDAPDPEFAWCWCRKPSPGPLVESAVLLAQRYGEMYPPHMGLFVGDRPEDEECARLAGFPFQNAAQWRAMAEEAQVS